MTTEQRLERLERENRWMRRIGAVAVAVAAAVFLVGQGKDLQDLEVQSLKVKDEDGKTRLEMETDRLQFKTRDGRVLLSLFAGSGDKPITFVRVGDKEKAQILLTAWDVLATADVSSGGSRQSVGLAASPDEAIVIALDANKKRRLRLGVAHTVDERTGAKTTKGTLTLYDAKGNVIWQAPR